MKKKNSNKQINKNKKQVKTKEKTEFFLLLKSLIIYINKNLLENYSNLLNFLLKCGTRPNEWGTQWDELTLAGLLTITLPEAPLLANYTSFFKIDPKSAIYLLLINFSVPIQLWTNLIIKGYFVGENVENIFQTIKIFSNWLPCYSSLFHYLFIDSSNFFLICIPP